jgi:hypothetical protein
MTPELSGYNNGDMGLLIGRRAFLVICAAAAGAACAVASPANESVRRWDLGRGFTAVATTKDRAPGGDLARRALEIRHSGVLVRRFASQDEGLGVQVGDTPVAGVRELLVLDYQDGSGACGTYRMYGGPSLREVWVRAACADTRLARLHADALDVWSAVLTSKTHASGSSPHCCWRVWGHEVLRWNGRKMRVVRRELGSAPAPSYQERLLPGALPPAP